MAAVRAAAVRAAAVRAAAVRAAAGPQARGGAGWLLAAVSLVLGGTLLYSRLLWSDAFYDLYAGRWVAAHGIPRVNVLTVAARGAPWIDQQWLAHLLYYETWRAGGYPALAMLSSALVTGAFAALGRLMLREGVPPARMFAWTLAAFAACLGNTEVRAQSFGYLFLALTIWLLAADRGCARPRRRTWLLVPVLVAWANTYGSAPLGAGLAVAYAGYRAARGAAHRDRGAVIAYAVLGALAVGSVACCPYGAGIAAYYRRFLGGSLVARYDSQWWPPRLSNPWDCAFFSLMAATALAVALAVRRGTRPDPLLASLAAILLALAFTTSKDIAWFGFGGSLLAASTLARAGGAPGPQPGTVFRRAVAGTLATGALACAVTVARTPGRTFEAGVPSRAVAVAARLARADPAARVLADEWTGTALLWLDPAAVGRVGFDIRLEQYPAADLRALYAFMFATGPGWDRLAGGYGIIVASRRSCPRLAGALLRLPGWQVAYSGPDGVVAERRRPG